MNIQEILETAKQFAIDYLDNVSQRRVFPSPESLQQLNELSFPLPDSQKNPLDILEQLNRLGSSNTVCSNGGRYFGFVFGGSLPAALGANWLATAWDQNAVFKVSSPIAAQIEKIA